MPPDLAAIISSPHPAGILCLMASLAVFLWLIRDRHGEQTRTLVLAMLWVRVDGCAALSLLRRAVRDQVGASPGLTDRVLRELRADGLVDITSLYGVDAAVVADSSRARGEALRAASAWMHDHGAVIP